MQLVQDRGSQPKRQHQVQVPKMRGIRDSALHKLQGDSGKVPLPKLRILRTELER